MAGFQRSTAKVIATHATSTEEEPICYHAERHQHTASVNPLFTCFGSANEGLPLIPGMLSIIRPPRIPLGSLDPLGSGTETWLGDLPQKRFCFGPTQTRGGTLCTKR